MRVLMFGWEYPPRISGGLGTACQGITKGLTGLGTEIVFVMPRIMERIEEPHVKMVSAAYVQMSESHEPDASYRRLMFRSVESKLMPYGGVGKSRGSEGITAVGTSSRVYGGPQIDYGADMLAEAERYGRAARTISREESFDVIHGHDWMTVHAGIEAKRSSGRPFIYHVHALEFDRSGEHINRNVYDIERQGLESADHIISVSQYTKNTIVERYGIHPDRVTVVHNAAAKMEGRKPYSGDRRTDRKIVLFLGRITFQKGPDYFIEAASMVLKRVPDAVFVMAGSGDMMPEMVEKVARLKMGRHFHLTGFLKGEDVERIYAMSDVYVMPSVSEPFGISTLEAMCRDVPVIISKQSGVSEVVQHALKTDFWDVTELSNKIIAVLTYPSLGREMTKRAGEEIEAVHWEAAAGKIMSVYGRVCGQGRMQ
jgi:glycogen(starch) synthase